MHQLEPCTVLGNRIAHSSDAFNFRYHAVWVVRRPLNTIKLMISSYPHHSMPRHIVVAIDSCFYYVSSVHGVDDWCLSLAVQLLVCCA